MKTTLIPSHYRVVEFFGPQFINWYRGLSAEDQEAVELTFEALECLSRIPEEWFHYPFEGDSSLTIVDIISTEAPLSVIAYRPYESVWIILGGCQSNPKNVSSQCLQDALNNRQDYDESH